jgi:aryl-alcohol dehydrogenase-like predicted oxidoreductase
MPHSVLRGAAERAYSVRGTTPSIKAVSMRTITLGSGLDVSRLGLGCMGMSAFYTGSGKDDPGATRTLHRALELGVTFFDTAEMYGPYTNEELVGRALRDRRDDLVIATKFGTIRHTAGDAMGPDGSPENVRLSVEGSLRRLGTDYIDLYYQHRMDPSVPVEDTMGALAELVHEGKIRHIGLSPHDPPGARRAPGHRAPDRVLPVEQGPGAGTPSPPA